MVRMTIACTRCRQLKIKCLHDGVAPCRHCERKGSAATNACVLSAPVLKAAAINPRRPRARARPRPPSQPGETSQPRQQPSLSTPPRPSELSEEQFSQDGYVPVLASTRLDTVLAALGTFHRKFPELRFLHLPNVTQRVQALWPAWQGRSGEGRLAGHAARDQRLAMLCTAVLALCGLENDEGGTDADAEGEAEAGGDKQQGRREAYAEAVRAHVAPLPLPPDLVGVQTLVVLAMYEWAMGHGYRAWMYSGAAARTMQALLVLLKPAALSATDAEERNRTFWSCFVLDRMIFCGQPQPFQLSLASLTPAVSSTLPCTTSSTSAGRVSWPSSETYYIFGPGRPPLCVRATEAVRCGSGMDHYYGRLVHGFDIWARILHFVVSGGRRQPGLCEPENHPWVAGSPWRLLYDELQAWWQPNSREGPDCDGLDGSDSVEARLRYPETAVAGHAALGQGQAEAFGYLNLLYYIGILFLGREYIPLLPAPHAEPAGPVDAPLLTDPAPEGWWAARATALFTAATHIVALLDELAAAGAALDDSPFAGFCSFSAATMNIYAQHFPRMNPGATSSASASATVAANLRFLRRFQARWPMGAGWWVTLGHCRALYAHASRHGAAFAGRTRADFAALEYSIHDVRGQPPPEGTPLIPGGVRQDLEETETSDAADATEVVDGTDGRGEEPEGLTITGSEDDAETTVLLASCDMRSLCGVGAVDDLHSFGSQIWPLWDEQPLLRPMALEGVPLDYDLDVLT